MTIKRRPGEPRMNWLDNSLKKYDLIESVSEEAKKELRFQSRQQQALISIFKIKDTAEERQFSCETKPKPKCILDNIFRTPNERLEQ